MAEDESRKPISAAFDAYAGAYESALSAGLSVSGEGKDYYARGRVRWLKEALEGMGFGAKRVLDFGCGTGSAVPLLLELPGVQAVVGVDVSEASLEVGRGSIADARARFERVDRHSPAGEYDLAFCNGVFHHIPMPERRGAAEYVCRALRPGGLFAFWENNPWNPGTRYIMSRIPFDREAEMLWPGEARRLLRSSGFEVLNTRYLFIFPRMLWWMRWSEVMLSRWPAGGQYLVLCRKRVEEAM